MACEDYPGVTLESYFAYDGDFVATLRTLGGHFGHLRAAWGHLRVTLGLLGEHLRHMGVTLGVTLGSDWGQFEYLWVPLGHLMDTLQFVFESLWVWEGPFSKKYYPYRFLMIL